MNNIDVLVFGSQSSGKSSLIKLLTQRSQNPVYSQTYNGFKIEETNYQKNGQQYVFTELKSFDLSRNDSKYDSSFQNYKQNFLNYCSNSQKSFNLVIHVMKRQSILETDQINYDIIIRNLFRDKARTMCVITFSEEIIDLTRFWRQHRRQLKKRELLYNTGAAVCCGYASNPMFEMGFKQQRDVSYELLWSTISKITLNSKKIAPTQNSLSSSIVSSLSNLGVPSFITSYILKENTEDSQKKLNDQYIIWIFGQNDEDISDFAEDLIESLNVSFFNKIYYRFKSISDIRKEELLKLLLKNIMQSISATNIFILMNDIDKPTHSNILYLMNFFKLYFPSENFLLTWICNDLEVYDRSEKFIKEKKEELELETNNKSVHFELINRSIIDKKHLKFFNENLEKIENEILDKLNRKQKMIFSYSLDEIYKRENWPNKVIFNNNNVDIDLYECALFADCTKLNEESFIKIKNKRWFELKLEPEENRNKYFGVCFFREFQKHVLVVMAHRGTQFNHLGNVLADFQIALNETPDIVEDALAYEKRCLKEIKSFDKSIIVLHIGFSLGGYIAAACVEKNNDSDIKKFAVTLDAPGTGSCNTTDTIVNYFLSPNVVNTCNKHSGRMYQIMNDRNTVPLEENCMIELDKTSFEDIQREIEYSFESHNLDLLLDIVKVNAHVQEVDEWPIGKNFQDGELNHQRSNIPKYIERQ